MKMKTNKQTPTIGTELFTLANAGTHDAGEQLATYWNEHRHLPEYQDTKGEGMPLAVEVLTGMILQAEKENPDKPRWVLIGEVFFNARFSFSFFSRAMTRAYKATHPKLTKKEAQGVSGRWGHQKKSVWGEESKSKPKTDEQKRKALVNSIRKQAEDAKVLFPGTKMAALLIAAAASVES